MNSISVIGNLTKNPDLYVVEEDFKYALFSVADNVNEDETIFHQVKVYGKLADVCYNYLVKGSKVYINGTITEYKKDDKIYRTIIANKVEFLSPKKKEETKSKNDEKNETKKKSVKKVG